MLLLISHAGANKGVTGYYRDHLENISFEYLYLAHPFPESTITNSTLIYTNKSNKKTIVAKYWVPKNAIVAMIVSLFVTIWVVLRHGKKLHLIIGYGSFNTLAAILLKPLYRYKVYFWGVDYSSRRFANPLLNTLYLMFETIACKRANLIIQPTKRQEEVRIKKHGLKPKHSLIVPNGVTGNELEKITDKSPDLAPAFIYLGSITEQHGIVNLIEEHYATKHTTIPIYILGGGPLANRLVKLIEDNRLSDIVHYLGYKSSEELKSFIRDIQYRCIGIAPYREDGATDHVYYGDSLKLKEYLMYGMPYLISTVVEVPTSLQTFGAIYKSDKELQLYLTDPKLIPKISSDEVRSALQSYIWERLYSTIPLHY